MTSTQPTAFGLPSDTGAKDFGIFMPIANGGWILSSTTPPIDGSYEYNRAAALLAEEIGLDFIMSMAQWLRILGWSCIPEEPALHAFWNVEPIETIARRDRSSTASDSVRSSHKG